MVLRNSLYAILIAVFIFFSASIVLADDKPELPVIEIRSEAFRPEKPIPAKYTCQGDDISPDLGWSQPPEGTKELALICEDPDAPTGIWVHWIIYGIPADTGGFAESFPAVKQTETGIIQGENSWGRIGYGGPCPPRGKPHRYFFRLYALDKELGLKPGVDKKILEAAMKDHIIGYGELMGTYAR